jgi:hypothetical protein
MQPGGPGKGFTARIFKFCETAMRTKLNTQWPMATPAEAIHNRLRTITFNNTTGTDQQQLKDQHQQL